MCFSEEGRRLGLGIYPMSWLNTLITRRALRPDARCARTLQSLTQRTRLQRKSNVSPHTIFRASLGSSNAPTLTNYCRGDPWHLYRGDLGTRGLGEAKAAAAQSMRYSATGTRARCWNDSYCRCSLDCGGKRRTTVLICLPKCASQVFLLKIQPRWPVAVRNSHSIQRRIPESPVCGC